MSNKNGGLKKFTMAENTTSTNNEDTFPGLTFAVTGGVICRRNGGNWRDITVFSPETEIESFRRDPVN